VSFEIRPCPFCDNPCDADWVDVGIGHVQCGPYHCVVCGASEIGGFDASRELTSLEKAYGWYGPGSEPGSSANVVAGKVVSANAMNDIYRKEFVMNPLHSIPGYVEDWRENVRKRGVYK